MAASRGVKIYAIGMGSLLGVPLPYVYEDGRVTYAVDHRGNVVKTRLDMELLKEVARLTGGKAYNAADNKSLEAVLSDIAKLEKREAYSTTKWEYKELAPVFLLAAFLLLALDLLLGMTILRILP